MRAEIGLVLLAAMILAALAGLLLNRKAKRRARRVANRPIQIRVVGDARREGGA